MTLFGIIWMLISIWAFSRKSIKPLMAVTLFGMTLQCNNVIEFGGLTCGPQLISSALFIAKSYTYRAGFSLGKICKTELTWVLLIIYIMVNLFVMHANVAQGRALNVLMISVYVWAFLQFRKMSKDVDEIFINKCVRALTTFLLFVAAIQFVIELLRLPKNTILATLIYNDSGNTNICYYNKNAVRIYSTFMEPSYCAAIFVGALFYVWNNAKRITNKNKNILIVALVACILLTESSTAYGTLAILFALYGIQNSNKKKTWIAILVSTVAVLFLMTCTDVLDTVIFDKMSSGSGKVRSRMNNRAFENFLQSKWIGVGYKNSRGSSIVPTILSELGIVGFIPYVMFVWWIFMVIFKSKKDTVLQGTAYMVMASIISQIIACPDMDLCTFWLSMYFYAMAAGSRRIREQHNKQQVTVA